MLKYEWIEGTRKGNGNKDLIYTSLIFDLKNKRMYSTEIFRFGSENQFIRFDQGAIGEFELVEK